MNDNRVVWLALRMPTTSQESLEILGIFDNAAAAEAVATTLRDVIGPVPLNVALPDGLWEQGYYPQALRPRLSGLPAYDEKLADLGRCRCVVVSATSAEVGRERD